MALYTELTSKCFLTGSRAFGTHLSGSDFDLVVLNTGKVGTSRQVEELLENASAIPYALEQSGYFKGTKYTWRLPTGQDLVFNLVPLNAQAAEAWYLTTLAMAASYKESLGDRAAKYGLFETMVGAFKIARASASYDAQAAEFPLTCIKMKSSQLPSIVSGYEELKRACEALEKGFKGYSPTEDLPF